MAFLRQPLYGDVEQDWRSAFPQSIPHWSVPPFLALQAPFQARREEGRLRLLTLLQRIMIRASKEELINLGIPRLHSKVGCPRPPGRHQPPLPPVVSAASPAPAANAVPSSAAAFVRPLSLSWPDIRAVTAVVEPTSLPAALQVTLVPFAPMHAASWNGLVDIVRFNLITADWCVSCCCWACLWLGERMTSRLTQALRRATVTWCSSRLALAQPSQ